MRDAPPPSPALLERLGSMQPVGTRVPWRSFALVLAIWAGLGTIAFALTSLRPDLELLPRWWVAMVAVVWAAAVLAPLHATLVPRHGQVLPDPARAGLKAFAAVSVLLVVAFVFTVDAPGHTRPAIPFGATLIHCLAFVLRVWAAPFLVGLLAIRKLAPVGSWRIGAALGAAGGAVGGLVLHFACPYGEALHVGLGHAGGVVLCALLGAVIAPLIVRR